MVTRAAGGSLDNASEELRVIAMADELVDGKADGAVTIDSATIKTVTSVKRFSLCHNELISLPGNRPEASPVFRWLLKTLASESRTNPRTPLPR